MVAPLAVRGENGKAYYVFGNVRIAMLLGREALIQNGDVPQAHVHRLETEIALLREELRIIGARMARVSPQRRPQYTPVERMAILELRAMRGWSKYNRNT